MAPEDPEKKLALHPTVFFVSAALILTFVLLGVFFTDTVAGAVEDVQAYITSNFGWFYIASVGLILVFVFGLAFTPYGAIRLGPNDAKPEFGYLTWFAMLFSAGMGIGLLFFSVAEPIMHFDDPPTGEGGDEAAAKRAITLTYFHWGLHPWAIYALVGLSFGYFSYRRGLPLTIRSALYPVLGKRVDGPIGNAVDIVAVVSTLFGVATSLGLGVMQINAGIGHVFGVAESRTVQLILIACITAVATISVVSGLHVGIRRLSEFNVAAGILLCVFLLLVGPTLFIAKFFVQSLGAYLQQLPAVTFWTATFEDNGWLSGWTIFYWAWWIAWAPFVGMFIARVSYGRTVRQVVVGVLLAPSLATFFWLSVFGGTALHQELFAGGGISEIVAENVPVALFTLLERFPLATGASIVATLVIMSFFVTSSDSGSLVIDIITSGGHPNPPVVQRIFWAVLEGVVAGVLLVTGGLTALQTASITTALPFSVILLVMMYSLIKGFRQELPLHPSPRFEPPALAGEDEDEAEQPVGATVGESAAK